MPEYLTKEEIRQWRSSLERITLEEYAARLGKVIQGEKHTNDMIDKVMTHTLDSMQSISEYKVPSEKIQTIAIRAMQEHSKPKKEASAQKEIKKTKEVKEHVVKEVKKPKEVVQKEEITISATDITFKKPLIPREQMIFDYLVKNKGTIVYAKDMAALLELPRDYVYKYIKNLRQKLNEDVLFNADNGGYILKV